MMRDKKNSIEKGFFDEILIHRAAAGIQLNFLRMSTIADESVSGNVSWYMIIIKGLLIQLEDW